MEQIQITTFAENTDAVLNSAECTNKTSNVQSEETKQLPIADTIDHLPVASTFHVPFTFANAILECLKMEKK